MSVRDAEVSLRRAAAILARIPVDEAERLLSFARAFRRQALLDSRDHALRSVREEFFKSTASTSLIAREIAAAARGKGVGGNDRRKAIRLRLEASFGDDTELPDEGRLRQILRRR